jgi:tetratricopeptide (TPR) repeat protein
MEQAVDSFRAAASIAKTLGDRRIERDSLGWIGETYRRLGRLDEAIEMLGHAVRLYVGTSDGVQGTFRLALSLACSYRGRPNEAVDHARDLLQLSTSLNDSYMKAQGHNALSIACLIGNRLDVALRHVEAALSIYEQEIARGPVGSLDPMGYVLNTQGMIELRLHQFDRAMVTLRRGREIGRQVEGPRVEAFCLFNYARGLNMSGREEEALAAAESAAKLLAETGAPEAYAATALADAIRASAAGDSKSEARSLLACATVSVANPDILSPQDLLKRAAILAEAEELTDVVEAVQTLVMELERVAQLVPTKLQEHLDIT